MGKPIRATGLSGHYSMGCLKQSPTAPPAFNRVTHRLFATTKPGETVPFARPSPLFFSQPNRPAQYPRNQNPAGAGPGPEPAPGPRPPGRRCAPFCAEAAFKASMTFFN